MKDDHTKVEITKTDITGEQEIEGAKKEMILSTCSLRSEWKVIRRSK